MKKVVFVLLMVVVFLVGCGDEPKNNGLKPEGTENVEMEKIEMENIEVKPIKVKTIRIKKGGEHHSYYKHYKNGKLVESVER